MIKYWIMVAVLVAFFVTLLAVPGARIANRLGGHKPGSLWVKMIGALGVLWVALFICTSHKLGVVHLAYYTEARLRVAKDQLGGAMGGLALALLTRRFPRERVHGNEGIPIKGVV